MTPGDSSLGGIMGVTNAVMLEGDAIGATLLTGPGAGGGPTASAVLADIVDVARGNCPPTFGLPAADLSPVTQDGTAIPDEGAFYLRVTLKDQPGTLAEVATALGACGVSIHRMRQHDHAGDAAPVTIVTHRCALADIEAAKERIAGLSVCTAPPVSMRIVES